VHCAVQAVVWVHWRVLQIYQDLSSMQHLTCGVNSDASNKHKNAHNRPQNTWTQLQQKSTTDQAVQQQIWITAACQHVLYEIETKQHVQLQRDQAYMTNSGALILCSVLRVQMHSTWTAGQLLADAL
jgi:hypothetical protein